MNGPEAADRGGEPEPMQWPPPYETKWYQRACGDRYIWIGPPFAWDYYRQLAAAREAARS